MAVVPIFGDQPSNAEAVAKANCGVSFKDAAFGFRETLVGRERFGVGFLAGVPQFSCSQLFSKEVLGLKVKASKRFNFDRLRFR